MITPIWLIEADVFGRSFEPVKSEIRSQGMVYEILQPHSFLNGVVPTVGARRLQDGDCVVFSGAYPLMRQIQLHHRWVPGGWCNLEEFDCARYYPHLGAEMLNHDCAMLTLDDALAQVDPLFERFGEEDRVFIRPCGMEKTFTGRCVTRDDFVMSLQSARWSKCHALVTRPQPIGREWRLVVADSRVVAASQYHIDGVRAVERGCPDDIISYATRLLGKTPWRPDPIFMLDICEGSHGPRVMELNSFSCSGLYQCDPREVVAEVKRLAIAEWETSRLTRASVDG